MFLLDLTLPTLAENLALDEALLLAAEDGGPEVLRFWTWSRPAVILGAGGRRADEAELDRCHADGVPVLRRSSGGGTVLLGEGCLLFSLILAFERQPILADLRASYDVILDRVATALVPRLPGVRRDGISDLVWNDRKFSGNAQQRKRAHVLHHGTLLHHLDLSLVPRYVKHPPRMPEYRRDRPHGDFIANVPLTSEELKRLLGDAWSAQGHYADWPRDRTHELVNAKYGLDAWHERR